MGKTWPSFVIGTLLVTAFPPATEGSHLTHHLRGEKSELVRRIAENRRCIDGTIPDVVNFQTEGEVMAYTLQCNDIGSRNGTTEISGLDKRAIDICSASCNRVCYHPADYNPDPKDCSQITSALRSAGGSVSLSVGQTLVRVYRTCTYTLTNQARDTVNFCNSAWASIGDGIAWTCGRWLDDPAKGGICTTSSFYVEAVRTPNTPGPSYTLVHSTNTPVNLDTSTSSPRPSSSRTSVTSSSRLSTSTASVSQSTTTTGSSDATGVTVIGSSTISLQDIPDLPSAANSQQDDTGDSSVGSESSDDDPSKKSNTATIVGATIGSIALVVLLIAAFIMSRKMRRLKKEKDAEPPLEPYAPESPRAWSIPTESASLNEKRAINPTMFRPYLPSGQDSFTPPISETSADSSVEITPQSQEQRVGPSRPQLHPRSMEALIAAAAPPNMSRDQIDQLTANFVSLVRGRQPRDDGADFEDTGTVLEPPPYQGS